MASTPWRGGIALVVSLLVLPACGSELEGRASNDASEDTADEVETAEPEVEDETPKGDISGERLPFGGLGGSS